MTRDPEPGDVAATTAVPIRIFPLPNVVLFPSVRLPLHNFEPPYRAMTREALDDDRVIGMVLLDPGAPSDEEGRPAVFNIGCTGVIVEHHALDDGRFHLILEGQSRFRIASELRVDDPFRRVHADLLPDPAFADLPDSERLELERERVAFEDAIVRVVRGSDREAAAELRQRLEPLDPVKLANTLAFGLDASPIEKQALLEARSALERTEMLRRILEFLLAEKRLPDTSKNAN